ncbi:MULTISPECIES: type IV pilin protein [unclassified Psychrobacter]|uniref:type IV pilin protein n=1 Tax=unclassified Psychrobacter TaxID=196806 RepID=UPI0018F46A4B|nr:MULTISPECIES: type IV pilin protein [unclassified Psychrobacter]
MVISTYHKKSAGFTLIEMMIVVAIIGILAAIAYPSYQQYVIKSNRADMMSEMQNIAQQIERQKLSAGTYTKVSTTGMTGDYPRQGTALYTVSLPNPLTNSWTITATPKTGTQMASDGVLTLNSMGVKCRADVCGSGDEWKQ